MFVCVRGHAQVKLRVVTNKIWGERYGSVWGERIYALSDAFRVKVALSEHRLRDKTQY